MRPKRPVVSMPARTPDGGQAAEQIGPSTRIAPLSPKHTPELAPQFDSFFATLGFVPNSVLTMQRKPKLVRAFVEMQKAIWEPESKVDRGFKRLLAHLASRVAQDPYSMAHTASGALHFGVAAEKLAGLANYRDSPLYTAGEIAALDLALAASAMPNAVTDEIFAAASGFWSEEQMVEIVATVAMAGFLARWNVTMLTPLEDEPLSVGKQHLARHGWTPGRHRPTET
jgi:alkylhydroperoxidase family enzyme